MPNYADHIQRIEIKSLWSGHKHIVWELHPKVNVLSGKNGAGKSTILARLVAHIAALGHTTGALRNGTHPGVKVELSPRGADCIRYDIIRSFDRQLVASDHLSKLADESVITELDWQLYQLQRRYLDYQVNVGNRMIALLTSGDPEAREQAMAASEAKQHFLDLIDELFSETGKRIDRESNELRFFQYDEAFSPYVLSSGEKQMLIILLTTLIQDRQPYVLFMDEPEVSLHFDWQKRLIGMVQSLNPNAQIILTTHSPAVIMDGWEDHVTEVEDITV